MRSDIGNLKLRTLQNLHPNPCNDRVHIMWIFVVSVHSWAGVALTYSVGDFVARFGCKGKFEDLKLRDELMKFLTLFLCADRKDNVRIIN